jgi:eukaryotic-like serine/threonine-protein kinase
MAVSSPDESPLQPELPTQMQRSLGRFRLLQLLGKSQRTMAWRVHDPRHAQELVLVLPRSQPADADAAARWEHAARRAARLEHPHLAAALDIGTCELWPYVLYDAAGATTLSDRLQAQPLAGNEAAALVCSVLHGLAFAHEGGVAHHDIQPYLVLVAEPGAARLMGLEVAMQHDSNAVQEGAALTSVDALSLTAQREAARLDVLAVGLVLHLALTGKAALDEADIGVVMRQLPPFGRDLVRLPWTTPMPVADALRAIANRATDRQPRQRYASARTLLRALEGWIQSDSINGGEPLALLIDRLHSVGALPASPGSAERAARLAMMERHRTNELAEVVLQDLALSFEMLRVVNSAQVRGAQAAGSGPVLTIRRAIAMLGLEGVRRAALGLRAWPGPFPERPARDLQSLFDQVKRAGRVAQALRPAGYDAEVVFLLTLLQNLGRLITSYHFPDELQQIRRLMQSAPSPRVGEPDEPGMSEQSASFAVLGTDVEAIGAAVARHWGLDDAVLYLIRRLPASTPPRNIENDDDVLRAVASCANEAVDALGLPAEQQPAAVARVAQRYGRALNISLRDLQGILNLPKTGRRPASEAAAPQAEASTIDTRA